MSRRITIELVLLVAVVAMFARWTYHFESPRPVPILANFSIGGVELGMTRDQVRAKLGPPLKTEAEIEVLGFEKDLYKTAEGWGEPEVTYNTKGFVVRVFGELPLQWPGGSMDTTTTEADILEMFPNALVKTRPSIHPWHPGKILVSDHSLFIMTDREGLFSRVKYFGAGLALPYAYEFRYSLVNFSGGGNLLATTGKMSDQLTPAKAEKAEALACYFCAKRIKKAKYLYDSGQLQPVVLCPECGNQTVLAGPADELTVEFLENVQRAWFEPPSAP